MLTIGPLGFLVPWLLGALLILPIVWWFLRVTPPRPDRRKFPGVSLLLGLNDEEVTPQHTPLVMLLLRLAVLAAAILAFSGPLLNPTSREGGTGPLVLLVDGSWAQGAEWANVRAALMDELETAQRDARPVFLHSMTEKSLTAAIVEFQEPSFWMQYLPGIEPQPWTADRAGFATWLAQQERVNFETHYYSDGLRDSAAQALFDELMRHGSITYFEPEKAPIGLTRLSLVDGQLSVELVRVQSELQQSFTVQGFGPDPSGNERLLSESIANFESGVAAIGVRFDIPAELRNRLSRLQVRGVESAGTTLVLDASSKRRKVGLIAGVTQQEGQQFVSPLFFLRKALSETTDLVSAPLEDILLASPDVIVMADVGTFSAVERDSLTEWVEQGGHLIRFAGPRLAENSAGALDEDALLPVRLRTGGRNIGGAMSWGSPKAMRPFPQQSPFFGLKIPGEVNVTSQVVAQPDANLSSRVFAELDDGTPIVTGKSLGNGSVVLFHVTANADWSNLPLSGLFVQMLERLTATAGAASLSNSDLEGLVWLPEKIIDGHGQIVEAAGLAGVAGERLVDFQAGPDAPPGIYNSGKRLIALNLLQHVDSLTPMGALPSGVTLGQISASDETDLKPFFLIAALSLLLADIFATLWLSGALRRSTGVKAMLMLVLVGVLPTRSEAQQDDSAAIIAANETVLAYVQTGDAKIDSASFSGLNGLSRILTERTSIEPVEPKAIDIEKDELAFYPFLYWPISEVQKTPSDAAYSKLNAFLRNGGLIFFDTRDANLGASFGTTANGKVLQRIAASLDIPPLEPMPTDHVLTRTFYLLQEFPGRWTGSQVWVEASRVSLQVEGAPFRNLNDNVTPVIIGANDWAAAWALDETGMPMFPVGRGIGGERQREIAWRFGVNVIMHVMTGNYKSDQVHVPALLERLGQ